MIIGISGKIGTGKSATGKLLRDMIPGPVDVIPFARALKEEVAMYLGISTRDVFDDAFKDKSFEVPAKSLRLFGMGADEPRAITLREALQKRGQEARRGSQGYWVYRLRERVAVAALAARNIIIDDVRYPDEAEYVRGCGGLLVRVHPHQYWQAGPFADHESETALDGWQDWDMQLYPEFGVLGVGARHIAERLESMTAAKEAA